MAKVLNIYKDDEKIGSGPSPVHVKLDDGTYPTGTFKGSYSDGDKESEKVDFPAVTISTVIIATAIAASQKTAAVKVGDTKAITVSVTPENATDSAAIISAAKWTSSDDKIATVTDGTITAVAVGTATITVTSGTFTSNVVVTVSAAA